MQPGEAAGSRNSPRPTQVEPFDLAVNLTLKLDTGVRNGGGEGGNGVLQVGAEPLRTSDISIRGCRQGALARSVNCCVWDRDGPRR